MADYRRGLVFHLCVYGNFHFIYKKSIIMGRPILVQGLGCTETGAQIVLRELLNSAPVSSSFVVICNQETHALLRQRINGKVTLIGLRHSLWGRWLRLPLEIVLALLVFFRVFKSTINLSHYGLCLGGDYALYIHSPLLMDTEASEGWSEGRPNPLKRWMLNGCMRRARVICVQTPEMAKQLAKYCGKTGLQPKRIELLFPRLVLPPVPRTRNPPVFPFQLFYPTSRFAHKRADLAVDGVVAAHQVDRSCGLVITVPADGRVADGVVFTGRLSYEAVHGIYNSSDALLFTSERETLGLPLLEALGYGIPVVAPDLPYARSILGEAGCYFVQPTPECVAAAIARCKQDYQRLRANAVLQKAYIDSISKSWADHWETLLARRSA